MKASTIVEAILDGPDDPLKDFALGTPKHRLKMGPDGNYFCVCGKWGWNVNDAFRGSMTGMLVRKEYAKHRRQATKVREDKCHGMLTMSTIRDIQHRIVETLISGPAPSGWLLQEDVYKFSCTQIQAPADIAGFLMQWGKQNIPEESLYYDEKGDNGREVEPHVTVKYGLQIPAPNQALLQIIGTMKPFKVKLGLVSLFENPKFDVVKVDVDSPELHRLNRAISEAIPCKDTFPDYHPHMTIAYVKKGTGRALNGKNVFVDAPDVGSAFWAGNILFTGSGDSDDPDRVKQIIDFDHSKGPDDDLDESDDLKDFAMALPQWTVAMHKRGRDPLYVTKRGIHWVASPQLARRFGTQGEANDFLQLVRRAIRYNRDQLFVRHIPPLTEGFDPKEYSRELPSAQFVIVNLNGPKFFREAVPASAGVWVPDIKDATRYCAEEARNELEYWQTNTTDGQSAYRMHAVYESDIDPKGYVRDLPSSEYAVVVTDSNKSRFLTGFKGQYAQFQASASHAGRFTLEHAQSLAQRLVRDHHAGPDEVEVRSVLQGQRVRESQRVCVKVHSLNDQCSYYFDGNGRASKQPVPLDPHDVSRAKRAAEKIYGKGNVRVEPVNESKSDPFEGLGFKSEVSEFARRGRLLRKQRKTF